MPWDESRHALGAEWMHPRIRRASLARREVSGFECGHTRHFEQKASDEVPLSAGSTTRHAVGRLAHFARGVSAGRLGLARTYVKALPEWFATHLATMDAALAGCLKRV
jgi:hemerythrin